MILHMLACKHMKNHQRSATPGPSSPARGRWIEDLVHSLGEVLDTPSEDFPTPHCLTRMALCEAIQRARAELSRKGRLSSASPRDVRRHLENEGLLRVLDLAAPPNGRPPTEIYALDFGASRGIAPDPVELLQAAVPRGVVCYFSALAFHGLTTQPCSLHHIARLAPAPAARAAVPAVASQKPQRAPHDPLGTPLFRHDGLLYYLTNRDPALLPGIQSRVLHSHACIRIADYEQALLDTLHKPASCGGPAVVFEAWETGAGRLDEARLFERLHRIRRPLWSRRAGWMLQQFGRRPGPALQAWLEEARPQGEREPLLPGVPGRVFDPHWRLDVP